MESERAWYVGYGSNLDTARFNCYIAGGVPRWSTRDGNPGCRDKTSPREEHRFVIPHRMYFSGKSPNWSHMAVAFIDSAPGGAVTFARGFLVTLEQFADIAMQENNKSPGRSFTPEEKARLLSQRETVLMEEGSETEPIGRWYGRVINLGTWNGLPAFTLTATWDDGSRPASPPGGGYLKTVARGLHETYQFTAGQVCDYLGARDGIAGTATKEAMPRLVSEALEGT
jgi:hypothetical protein